MITMISMPCGRPSSTRAKFSWLPLFLLFRFPLHHSRSSFCIENQHADPPPPSPIAPFNCNESTNGRDRDRTFFKRQRHDYKHLLQNAQKPRRDSTHVDLTYTSINISFHPSSCASSIWKHGWRQRGAIISINVIRIGFHGIHSNPPSTYTCGQPSTLRTSVINKQIAWWNLSSTYKSCKALPLYHLMYYLNHFSSFYNCRNTHAHRGHVNKNVVAHFITPGVSFGWLLTLLKPKLLWVPWWIGFLGDPWIKADLCIHS